MEAAGQPARTTIIEPAGGKWWPDLRELWDQRDLMYYMCRRDVSVRYKQAIVGFAWAIVQPLFFAAVFSVFFGLLAKVPSAKGIPYPLFAASGMVLWLAFADGLTTCSFSTVMAAGLISKIYFPRLVIPIAAVTPAMIDLIIGFLVMIPIAWAYGFEPRPQLLLFPLLFVLTLATTLGAGLWFSALNVRYRDIVMVVPFFTLVGLFITPIVYPIDLVPENLLPLYVLNPVSGVMELYRWMLLPTDFPGLLLLIPVVMSALFLISGAMYFKRAEPGFADVI